MWGIVEQLKAIQHIGRNKYLSDDLNINYNTFLGHIHRNHIPLGKITAYCFAKKINLDAVLYETRRTL